MSIYRVSLISTVALLIGCRPANNLPTVNTRAPSDAAKTDTHHPTTSAVASAEGVRKLEGTYAGQQYTWDFPEQSPLIDEVSRECVATRGQVTRSDPSGGHIKVRCWCRSGDMYTTAQRQCRQAPGKLPAELHEACQSDYTLAYYYDKDACARPEISAWCEKYERGGVVEEKACVPCLDGNRRANKVYDPLLGACTELRPTFQVDGRESECARQRTTVVDTLEFSFVTTGRSFVVDTCRNCLKNRHTVELATRTDYSELQYSPGLSLVDLRCTGRENCDAASTRESCAPVEGGSCHWMKEHCYACPPGYRNGSMKYFRPHPPGGFEVVPVCVSDSGPGQCARDTRYLGRGTARERAIEIAEWYAWDPPRPGNPDRRGFMGLPGKCVCAKQYYSWTCNSGWACTTEAETPPDSSCKGTGS